MKSVLAAGICALLLISAPAFSQTQSRQQTLDWIDRNEDEIQSRLRDYNERHRVLSTSRGGWKVTLQDWRLERIEGDRVFLEIDYKVGSVTAYQRPGTFLFELAWKDGALAFQRHWSQEDLAKTAAAAAAPAAPVTPPLKPKAEVETYIARNLPAITAKLRDYNEDKRVARFKWDSWQVALTRWTIERLDGDRVFLAIDYGVGSSTQKAPASALFELQWVGDDLAFVGHQPAQKRRVAARGGPDPTEENKCIFNYYSPRPCIDVKRKWQEFAALHELPMNEESAAILQAYKQLDYDRGDRLMAGAKGLALPQETSAFSLQAEVTRMNLPRSGGEAEACTWNPFGPNPCPGAHQTFRTFAARHGLEPNAQSARMFEAYTRGDFKTGDVIYALAKNLEVPAYGHIPSAAARDLATLWPELTRISRAGEEGGCEIDPHAPRPCEGAVRLWRDFAERYDLEDTAANARIFAAYAQGDLEAGDSYLADAKGVTLDQLMEASGIPTRKLTIEVYPGWRQMLRDLLIGT
ncbi:MAG: hypothetical protein AAF495_29320 [Pseudomonadota bacterium]